MQCVLSHKHQKCSGIILLHSFVCLFLWPLHLVPFLYISFCQNKTFSFFLFFFTTPPKSLFNEMSKLHLVLVFATAHFLPVGISTPNLTRTAAVLILFIIFYVFRLIFFSILSLLSKDHLHPFLPEQKWPPEGSFLRRRAIGKALRRKISAESTSQLLTALSKDLHVIWKKAQW